MNNILFKDLKINYHYTSNCDMHCRFCFANYNDVTDKVLVLNTFKKLTSTTNYINLAGGEVFTDIDLLVEIVKIGVSNGVNISLVSNGFILANNLDNSKIKYILSNICTLGISIDTFNDAINRQIRRCDANRTLTKTMFEKIVNYCNSIDLPVKVSTSVCSYNKDENLSDYLRTINISKWKRLQVATYSKRELDDLKISDIEFKRYCINNTISKIDCRNESTEIMNDSYLICNQNGHFYIEEENKNLNIDDILKESSDNNKFELIKNIGFNVVNYNYRYNQTIVDLHIHSTHSDGTKTPVEICEMANQSQLTDFAITDHDTTSAYDNEFVRTKVTLFGAELSCKYDNHQIHVLVYTKNYSILEKINNLISRLSDSVYEELYLSLKSKYPKLERITKDNVTRKDYVNKLVELGYFKDYTSSKEANDDLYSKISEPKTDIRTLGKLRDIHKNDLVVVLAHPFHSNSIKNKIDIDTCEQLISELKTNDLIDGIEALYKDYSAIENNFLLDLSDKYNLLISGGSDYHGRVDRNSNLGIMIPNSSKLITNRFNNNWITNIDYRGYSTEKNGVFEFERKIISIF